MRDVTSVASRLQLHQELKAEIDAREDTFRTVAENGRLMIDAGHFAAADVCFAFYNFFITKFGILTVWQFVLYCIGFSQQSSSMLGSVR